MKKVLVVATLGVFALAIPGIAAEKKAKTEAAPEAKKA